MSSQIIPVEPFDYVVFGGSGDLAERKLLPALYHRQIEGQFTEPTRIIGASRSALTHEEYRKFAMDALKEHLKKGEYDEAEVAKFCQRRAGCPLRRRLGPAEEAARRGQGSRAPSTSPLLSATSRRRSTTTS
jgi:glucose-6-phosphate 1-dehydrogenase